MENADMVFVVCLIPALQEEAGLIWAVTGIILSLATFLGLK